MKNVNFKQVKETAKTIALTVVIAGVAGFIAGVHYQTDQNKATNQALIKAYSTSK
jgi:hypothetical protein